MFKNEYANINTVGFDDPVGWKKEKYNSFIQSDDEDYNSPDDAVSESGTEETVDDTPTSSDAEPETETKYKKVIFFKKPRPKPKISKHILQEETDYIYEKKFS